MDGPRASVRRTEHNAGGGERSGDPFRGLTGQTHEDAIFQDMIARSRSHLLSLLENRVGRVHPDAAGEERRPGDSVPVKTYLFEGRGPVPPNPDDDRGPLGTLAEVVEDRMLRDAYSPRLHLAEDPDLATIEFACHGDLRGFVYVDCEDPRHWLLHTFAPSRAADRFVSAFAGARRDVGRAALPGELLEIAAASGTTTALTLGHERQVAGSGSGTGNSAGLRARVWGTRAERLLPLLNSPGLFSEGLALSNVEVRHRRDDGKGDAFCVDDVRWDGRIITRGPSLKAHLELAVELQECYVRQVATVESQYAVRIDQRADILQGRSLALHLTRPMEDLERFCRMVFSTASPFLLWGWPVMRGPRAASVAAVDLGFGQALAFEFTPDLIRVFLPAGTSGGTVLRFHANLQHRLDPRVRLLDQDERDVFQL